MMEGFKTGRKNTKTEIKLAKKLGMEVRNKYGDTMYREINGGGTLFTQAPYFITDPGWIPYMQQVAKEWGITLYSEEPMAIAEELLYKMSHRGKLQ